MYVFHTHDQQRTAIVGSETFALPSIDELQQQAGVPAFGMTLATRVYRLVPNIRSDNTGWGGTFNHGEILVRARSSGEARAIAARAEAVAAGEPKRATTQAMASALREPRLYSVRRDTSGQFPDEGEPGVLAGNFRLPDAHVLVPHGD